MAEKSKFGRYALPVILTCIVLAFIISVYGGGKNSSTQPINNEESSFVSSIKTNRASLSTEDQKILNQIIQNLTPTLITTNYYTSIKEVNLDSSSKTIIVKTTSDIQNLTFGKAVMYGNASSSLLFKEVFSSDPNIEAIEIDSSTTEKDNYGNGVAVPVISAIMSRAIYQKINWAGFDISRLSSILNYSGDEKNSYLLKNFIQ